ncbi:hypothetical protein [Mucilaginibacter phyllosphaerae]
MKNIVKAASHILLTLTIMLALAPVSNAQQLQQIQDSFTTYQQNTLQEKVFVHTDKSTYISGEIIWFKIYCVDATTHKPLDVSKVIYLDVLDNSQNAIIQAKIALKNGSGSGSLIIPVSSNSGNYRLRAYTNWMKNFSADYFFAKNITIINTLKSPEVADAPVAAYDVQFFPEGGNLVAGIANNIGFKAVNQSGKGISFTGAIINQQNDTVVRFRPLKFGMGHFAFTPVSNNTYKAVLKINGGKPIVKGLPVISSTGYVMQLTDAGDQTLDVRISGTTNGRIYLFAHTGRATKIAQSADMVNGMARFTINKTLLNDGISNITIFNSTKQPVCERLYFKRPKQALLLAANADKAQYTVRKRVSIQVTAKDATGKLQPADLSMAVYRADSLQITDQADIMSYLWLSSDLKGAIESPGYYLSSTTAEAVEATDNLMLTQGWRRFKWPDIIQNKASALPFLPEYNGHIVTAKITDAVTNAPANSIITFMGVPGKRVQMYPAKSDAEGNLLFNTKDFFGPNEIVVQNNTEIDTLYKIEVLSPFAEQYSKAALPAFSLTPAMQKSLEEESLGMQIQNIYAGNKLKRFYDAGIDSSGFYNRAYKSYKLDDYTRFTTMEEVLREYITEVNVFKPAGRFHIKMLNEKGLLNSDPLILLDGVPVFNTDKIMAVDPLKVRKLEVVNERYYWGPSVYEGILSFTTYKGDLGGVEMDPHAVVIDYEGMQLQREFYSPAYDSEVQQKSRTPDFRNLLYWASDVNTGAQFGSKITFYTSDQTGKYIGLIQGIAPNGDAGAQTFTFEVK